LSSTGKLTVAALKKMKSLKAPCLSGLTAEMIQATGGIGTQWILDLCKYYCERRLHFSGLEVKFGITIPIYKLKGDPMECTSYRGIKLLEHAMTVVERIFEHRIWSRLR